jgi:hypothetical protein
MSSFLLTLDYSIDGPLPRQRAGATLMVIPFVPTVQQVKEIVPQKIIPKPHRTT